MIAPQTYHTMNTSICRQTEWIPQCDILFNGTYTLIDILRMEFEIRFN